MDDYLKYRGKCKELSEQAVKDDPTLILVRGYYYDVFWGEQPHWWCKKPDGTIVDPTANQFPTKGKGVYEEFNGVVECAQCGTEIPEEKARIDGNYGFCSTKCNMRFVGL